MILILKGKLGQNFPQLRLLSEPIGRFLNLAGASGLLDSVWKSTVTDARHAYKRAIGSGSYRRSRDLNERGGAE
jgi:hypothetical protein